MTRKLRYNGDQKLEPIDGNPNPPNVGDKVLLYGREHLEGREWIVTALSSSNPTPGIFHTHLTIDDERTGLFTEAWFTKRPTPPAPTTPRP